MKGLKDKDSYRNMKTHALIVTTAVISDTYQRGMSQQKNRHKALIAMHTFIHVRPL